jgi:hypothetical protein
MKHLVKASVLAVGAALVTQAVQASTTADDLYLGFSKAGANDYLIDLGQASALTGSATVVNLTSYFDFNLFTSIYGAGNGAGVGMGVVGGKYVFASSSNDIYATAPVGADLSGFGHSTGIINTAITDLGNVTFPTAGNSVSIGSDSSNLNSWTANVTTFAGGSFYGDTGINPSAAINGGTLCEGLYRATASQGYTYLGYFTLSNPGQNDASLTFTPAAVPEPSACALIGGGSLLLLTLRRRSTSGKD